MTQEQCPDLQEYAALKAHVTALVLARQSMGGKPTIGELSRRLDRSVGFLLMLVTDTDQLTHNIGVRVPGAGIHEFTDAGKYILDAEPYLACEHIDTLTAGWVTDALIELLVFGHNVSVDINLAQTASGEYEETPNHSENIHLAMCLLEHVSELGGGLKIEIYYTARVGWCVWWRTSAGRYAGRAQGFAGFPLAVAKATLKYASRRGLPMIHVDEQNRIDTVQP